MTTLEQLGWNPTWESSFAQFRENGFEPGRVAAEDKHLYAVLTSQGELSGQAAGKMLFQTGTAADLPKVGDWVALSVLPNEGKAVIHHVMPRRTKLSRKVPGRDTDEQVLAANIDVVFLVQALEPGFNPRLIERQLTMVRESGAKPVIVLNKEDLCDTLREKLAETLTAAGDATVVTVSAKTGHDMADLANFIRPGETIVFIGPSGVGKSSLINRLYGEEIQATTEVRESDAKGRHTTTRRELILLPQGGIVIDTPGIREFQIWLADWGVPETFSEIEALAANCRFRDCTHTHETKCAVKQGVAKGQIPPKRYQNYLKLQRELAELEEARQERAGLDRKRQTKMAQRAFSKIKRQRD